MNSIRVGSQRKGTLFRVAFSFEGFSQSTLNDRHFQMHRLGKCIQPQRILEYREHNAPQSLYSCSQGNLPQAYDLRNRRE